jgi:hypothetical protein
MGVREIEARFEITCDGCRKQVLQAHKSRPAHWSDLHILRDLYDFQGSACADGSVKRLLCEDCSTVVFGAVNDAIKARTLLTPETPDAG